MDMFPPAVGDPRFELQAIARELDDLSPAEKTAPRPGGWTRPLLWSALALLVLVAFVGWLLVGPPIRL